ncbi:radical SAM protein [Euryarchaeota archaeon]|nr:radical SAM protein [Euryarchaeota archaeon]
MVHGSEIYGPGSRTVIWVQGCTLACKGCWNQDLWPTQGGRNHTVESLIERVKQVGDEGITLMGGEPLQQAPMILELIKKAGIEDLSIMLYSGYEEKELNPIQTKCVELSDIVILGRYIEHLRDTSLRWRGSSNQVVRYPTERHRSVSSIEENNVEIHMDENGKLKILGYPEKEFVRLFFDDNHL